MTSRSYELVVRGEIGDRFAPLFDGLRLERVSGTTVVSGVVRDQAHLHALLERVQELGLELVSLNPTSADHRPERSP